MELHINSSTGESRFLTPISFDFREIEKDTDYTIETDTYEPDTAEELKLAFGLFTSNTGLDAIGGIAQANDLVPQMEFIKTGDDFMPSIEFDTFSDSTQPTDWTVHKIDHYYKFAPTYTSGDNTQTFVNTFPSKSENFVPNATYYTNSNYANLFWTNSGGCFGAGVYQTKLWGDVYGVIASAGAVCGFPPNGEKHGAFPVDTAGAWAPRYRGYNGTVLKDWWTNINKRQTASYALDLHKLVAYKNPVRLVLCSFFYEEVEYYGCACIAYGDDDSLEYCGFWGVEAKWWNSRGSKYNYTVNPDGTSKKAVNPNYVNNSGQSRIANLPTNNPLVTGANSFGVDSLGVPYGYATYVLTWDEWTTAIKTWSSKLASFVDALKESSNALERLKADTILVSNPIGSILKAHTVPIPHTLIPTYATAPADLPLVRSGGASVSSLSTAGILLYDLNNTGRIVEFTYQNKPNELGIPYVTRGTSWYSDWTNTNVSLYIPFVGEVPLCTEQVLGHIIYVRFRVDVISGDFICFVSNGNTEIYMATGNCSIPITCASGSTLEERILKGLGTVITSGAQIASGNVFAVAGAIGGVTQSMQQQVAYSSVGGDSAGFSGDYKPMLIIKRPVPVTGDVGEIHGVVSGHIGRIEDAEIENELAFLSVLDVDLDGITTATDAEKREIEALLREGVYV